MDRPGCSKDFKQSEKSVVEKSTSKKVPNAGGNANQYSASNNRSLESKYWQEWGSYVSKYCDNILSKIVKHMRERYRGGIDLKLSLQEILTETDQLDIDNSVMEVKTYWLMHIG
ncbi:uncharacterized protein LOC119674846 [Teleopsis dalmanni]|uniref:uncharacterized protein LOC119674846 n=1 Tax=Teleopsis dalmanni TaxID=139649 RepID=UPI0018CE72D9|nr:uncharacterized protein LOC119674846 [Teleopsis dalmanni]